MLLISMPINVNQEYTPRKLKLMKKKSLYNLFFILDFLYLFIISIVFYFTLTINTNRVIHIPSGSVNNIVSYLSSTSYNLNILDNIALRIIGKPQSGWIDLQAKHMTKYDFLYKLTTSKAAMKAIKLTPGETSYFFLRDLSKQLNLDLEKLEKSYKKYSYKTDGNILAETYHLPLGMSEDRVIFFLINYTNRKYKTFSKKVVAHYDKQKWYKYITIASIIQKEAASIDEMPLISSVIHNRLTKQMKLQMDGTLNYGKYSHTVVTKKRIKSDSSDFNTYQIKGLPSSPVCAVSFDAIKAAIFPKKTNYLYFVKSKNNNRHLFTTSYKKHKNNIQQNQIIKKPKLRKETVTKKRKSIKNIWKSVH